MAFKSYGGLTWTGQSAEPYNSTASSAASLAVLVAAGGVGMHLATKPMGDGHRPIDFLAARSRLVGNSSPFQLFNTFRLPEILSPFTSIGYKAGKGSQQGVTYWDKSFLQSDSTQDWLRFTTGKSRQELRAAGIFSGMEGSTAADALVWEQNGKSTSGTLSAVFGGEAGKTGGWVGGSRTPLSSDVALQAMSHEVVNPFTKQRGLNRIAVGMMAAADMFSSESFKASDVFRNMAGNKQAAFMPMPSSTGALGSFDDLKRRSTQARGIAAFEMDRFNRLIGGVSEQLLGEKGSKVAKTILGVGSGIRPGPAGAQFARFGGRAAAVGAGVIAVSQLDWGRRKFGTPGEVAASGVVAGGLAVGASKMGRSPRQAAMLGLAAFGVQMVFPGFDQGVIQGLATTGVNADIMRANSLNPFNYLRRTLEGFAPGSTDASTGVLVGIAAVGATSVRLPRAGTNWAQRQLESFGPERLGLILDKKNVPAVRNANASVRDLYWQRVSGLEAGSALPHTTMGQRHRLLKSLKAGQYKNRHLDLMKDLNTSFHQAERDLEQFTKANPMNEGLEKRLGQIGAEFGGDRGLLNSARREGLGFLAQAKYSFFGANLGVDKAMQRRIQDMGFGAIGKMPMPTGRFGKLATVGVAAFGAHQLLTGGLLGSKDTADDLRDIYSGKKQIAVKASRFWEGGGTPFEGGDTKYYRTHQYNLMMNRVREKGVWGSDEDDISPIGKFFRKNFTYDLERRQYHDRPYPISNAAFSDVPIIGGVLASTIGRVIKPSKVMHAGDWMRPGAGGGLEYAHVFEGSRREPAVDLGAHHGVPSSPYSIGNQASFLSYQFRELEGMTGWAKNVVQQTITGEDAWGADGKQLADSSAMTSNRLRFWESQMGGALFTNEFLRRVLPAYRSEIDRINPIANSMPSWLPDKFKWGDPYRSVEWGESRLPGAGYAALHPELKGLDAEAYPLLYRYGILSDVAPMSAEYNIVKQAVYKKRQEGAYNDKQIAYMNQVDTQHNRVVSGFVEDRMHKNAIRLPGSSLSRNAWAGGQELARSVAAPAEYLVPMGFRPMQKLASDRGMIEQYEYERMYGTPLAFWDKPVRDWLRPSAYSALNMMGWQGKPQWRENADEAGEYFDKLEFQKWMMLKEQAELQGDSSAAERYRYAASNTRQGVNPQGSPMGIYWTMPAEERKFFNAFAHASGKDRHRIMEMVPSDQQHLYKAIWSRMDSGDTDFWAGASSAVSDGHLQQQLQSAAQYMDSHAQPPEDWIGWHEDVDMNDIKVRYVDRIGGELHDYGVWESQLKKSMQQPMLDGSADFTGNGPGVLLGAGLRSMGTPGNRGSWQASQWGGMMSTVQIHHDDTRGPDIQNALERFTGGY